MRWKGCRHLLCFVALGVLGLQAARPQSAAVPPEPERLLLEAQDARNTAVLRDFLAGTMSGLVRRAALAAGSVQDTLLVEQLAVLLRNGADSIRGAAAFALGQTGVAADSAARRRIAALLQSRLGEETQERPLLSLIEALGKCGDTQALAALAAYRTRPVPDEVDCEIALSIGRMAYRGVKSREATLCAVKILDVMTGPGRWKPAYALMRIADRDLLGEHASRIAAAAQDSDPDVRMFCAAAMGKVNDRRVAVLTLLSLASGDPDWRVRVNALKSLGGIDPLQAPDAVLALIQAAEDSNRHIALTAITTLPGLRLAGTEQARAARSLLAGIVANSTGRDRAPEQREAAAALARVFGAEAFADLQPLKEQGSPQRAAYAAALAHVPLEDARNDLLTLAADASPRVAAASLEALTTSARRSALTAAMKERIRASFIAALRADDVTVLTAAAGGLADSALADQASVPELLVTLQRLRLPEHAEAMTAIAEALGSLNDRKAVASLVALAREADPAVARAAVAAVERITGKPQSHLLPRAPLRKEGAAPDWQAYAWVADHRELEVRTRAGSFTILLRPDLAPFTCTALATLVRKGFYDGLTFHRVVPNFVVQGGDPRGDGWGGPGFTLRSEFADEPFERGTVGVASSGKDTEGSQFFVTHSRQPHLDGRYTIIGRVIQGMEVVDRLQAGDSMERLRFVVGADSAGIR